MNSTKKPQFRNFIGFAISGILFWLTFHNSGLRIKDLGLGRLELFYFIMADALLIFSIWVYSLRARLFWVDNKGKSDSIYSFGSIVVGNFYNCLLPGNLGEGMRAWHFSRKNQVPFLKSLSSILAEKWIDAQLFVALTVILFIVKPFTGHYVSYAIIYTAVTVIGLNIINALMRNNRFIEKRVLSVFVLLKVAGGVFLKLYWHTTLLINKLVKRGQVANYLMLYLTIYTLNVLQFLFLLKSAGVIAPVGGLYSAYLVAVCMMIIAVIPSAPSNLGVLHYGVYSALIFAAGQFGSTPDAAALQSYARFAVYVHLSYVIPDITMGVIFVVKERRSVF